MRPVMVVLVELAGDHDVGLSDRVEQLPVEELVAHRAVEPLDIAVLLRAAFVTGTASTPCSVSHAVTLPATNSSPLSLRMQPGAPCSVNSHSRVVTTALGPIDRAAWNPTATRGYSSTTLSSRSSPAVLGAQ
jgi:hypothetical protein